MTSAVELAATYFDPLAEQHGLHRESLDECRVVYRRGAVFLCVWFDYRGAEFDVMVGQGPADQPECSFYLSDILRLRDVVPRMGNAAYDEGNQRIVLEELARLTNEHAADFLAGDENAFVQGAEYKRQQREAYDRDSSLKSARSLAIEAAAAGNHADVIAALEPLEGDLSKLDLWRLNHARKHLSR